MPENSLPGFAKALELGVEVLELDVVISADLQVVVSHEPFLNPAICTDPAGQVIAPDQDTTWSLYHLPYAQIAACDCGSRGNPRFLEQQKMRTAKPLLKDVLTLGEQHYRNQGRPIFYNIEIKSTPEGDDRNHPGIPLFVRLVMDEVLAARVGQRTILQSFDIRALLETKRTQPGMRTALLVDENEDPWAKQDRLGFVPEVLSPYHGLVNPQLIQKAHAAGMAVIPWTVNSQEIAENLIEMGVDGLITDYPDRITGSAPRPD